MRFTIGNTSEHSNNVNLSINFTNVTLEEATAIINAIESNCKDQTGWGLKESKDHCDKLKEKYCVA